MQSSLCNVLCKIVHQTRTTDVELYIIKGFVMCIEDLALNFVFRIGFYFYCVHNMEDMHYA